MNLFNEKELFYIKQEILKLYPTAFVLYRESTDSYHLKTKDGKELTHPGLFLPAAKTVRQAWEQFAYGLWFVKVVKKSATMDENIKKVLSKKSIKEEEENELGSNFLNDD